jgi:two-component system sensor histidine kinase KdpD
MDDDGRPDPDEMLKRVQRESRGRLKIYIGLAPGVGKTFRMLEEAWELKKKGVDVVVGLIEAHGRADTLKLADRLEQVPVKSLEHRNIKLRELDLDAVVQRKPQLVLIDELAHTNAPGLSHEKRWQDVEELRTKGFNVATTLNVQHVESLNDVVARATGVRVQETVPDSVLESATEIVNVDLPVDELLRRLQEGKVYPPERIKTALQNFFQDHKLTALRELALQETARGVGSKAAKAGSEGGTRVLVAIEPGMVGTAEVLRKGARLAGRLNTDWEVVLVETPRSNETSRKLGDSQELEDDLDLARSLGGGIIRLKGKDMVETLLAYAKSHRIGQIVIGYAKRRAFGLKASTAHRLMDEARDIDIHVVRTDD